MALRELITKGITLDNIRSKTYNPDSKGYKELIKELIRLDVPILEIGSSSIGKSYSIRQFMEESGVKGEFLFVGTEKSEFIEGIPNLKGVTEGTAKFSYLKPYWFPDKQEIKDRLISGRDQINSLSATDSNIGGLWKASQTDFKILEDLKLALLSFKRTDTVVKAAAKEAAKEGVKAKIGKYIYEDAMLYLSTLQGYGNFWLILDEIDKVEKQDKDKYAPLLHIVRERELKGWKLSGMRDYPEYDIKFVTTIGKRIERLDAALNDVNADVTDTRIIAIANDLQTMEEESPALYRRFVKIIIRNSLYEESKASLPSGDPSVAVGYDWEKLYNVRKQELHGCIVGKQIGEEDATDSSGKPKRSGKSSATLAVTILQQMAQIEEEKTGHPLDEMNLAWTLGFLPEILFPGQDTRVDGDAFVNNKFIEDFNDEKEPYQTLLAKIIQDNFDVKYWVPLLECIYDKISTQQASVVKSSGVDADVEAFLADFNLTKDKFNSPNPKDVEEMIDAYNSSKLKFVENKYAEALEIQKKQARGEVVTDKSLAGLEGGTAKSGIDAIVFGNVLIQKSMNGKKPTELTRMLISSIPFVQTRFISSPYIPFDGANDLLDVHNSGMVNFIVTVSGKKFDNEAQAKEAASSVFSVIEPYRRFVVKYGIAAPDEYVDAITDSDYNKITNKVEVVDKIIANRPVIIDSQLALSLVQAQALRQKYYESIAAIKMLEKEVYQNLTNVVWPMIKNSAEADGLTDKLKEEVMDYCKKFPNTMNILAAGLDDTDGLDDLKLFTDRESLAHMVSGSEIDAVRKLN